MKAFENLEPATVWSYFNEILQIPRPSSQEEKIRKYLEDFGSKFNLPTKVDSVGNVLISKPATVGMENIKSVLLQSHLDMVCEKNSDTEFNFNSDPIEAWSDGEWIRAKGTTLGADDGIGIAAQLALLAAADIPHGPIECLFTVEEETGLTGAFGLEKGFFESKILLNLDSEDEGELFIGCAGGIDLTARFDYTQKAIPEGYSALKLSVSGLQGGHSGDDIHKGRGNSNKLLVRFLWEYVDEYDILIHSFEGGNLRNAIAREANSVVLVPEDHIATLITKAGEFEKILKEEFIISEPNVAFQCKETARPDWVIDEDCQANLLNGLYACAHGVYSWSQAMPDMVETSTNLAAVKFVDGRIIVTTSQRSSLESAKSNIANMVDSAFILAGAETERGSGYPGWNPNPKSEIVEITASIYSKMFENKPIVRAIHAGLECGLFLEKYPDLDMISFGPTIRGAHSPDERLEISTVSKFWDLLLEVLKQIPPNE